MMKIIMIVILLVGSTILLAAHGSIMEIATNNSSTIRISHNDAAQCEGCHINPEYADLIPQANVTLKHKKQGIICASCHLDRLHPAHELVFEGDPDFCSYCHGDPPIIPTKPHDFIVCEDCHGYPDPYLPSYGNLIEIHTPRNIECIKCHTKSFIEYHKKFIT